jgi:hypothetical protein
VGTSRGWCSLHALLEDGVAAGLADDEVGPLHYYDAGKEGCVACELHHLPLLVGLGECGQREVRVSEEEVGPEYRMVSGQLLNLVPNLHFALSSTEELRPLSSGHSCEAFSPFVHVHHTYPALLTHSCP